jgi:hypothetical protein
MKIDEVIQRTNFEDNYQRAVTNIQYTYNWLNQVFHGDFQTFKLTDIAGNLTEQEAETLSNLLDKLRGVISQTKFNS